MREKIDILLLDDEPDLAMMMETILKHDGYTVQRCASIPDFRLRLQDFSPTLVIMDMMLAGSDGKDLCRELKTNINTNHIKILMISGHADADSVCRDAGADDFLGKPFDMDQFTSKIAGFIKKTAA